MKVSERPAQLPLTRLVVLERFRCHQQAIDAVRNLRGLSGKISHHRAERDEYLPHIESIVARVLILGRHHADNRIREIAHVDRLAERRTGGKELFLHIAAEDSDAARFALIIPVIEAALGHRDGPNLGERRQRADHRYRSGVVEAAHARICPQFRQDVSACRRLRLHEQMVSVFPVHGATGPRASGLHARPSREDDHDVLAEVCRNLLLSHSHPLACSHHQRDGDYTPGDSEHGEEGAQLVRPERA